MGFGNAKFFVCQGARSFLRRVLASSGLPRFKKAEQRWQTKNLAFPLWDECYEDAFGPLVEP